MSEISVEKSEPVEQAVEGVEGYQNDADDTTVRAALTSGEWIRLIEPGSKKFYYYSAESGLSVWNLKEELAKRQRAKADPAVERAIKSGEWKQAFDTDSKQPYFFHVKTRKVCWELTPEDIVLPSEQGDVDDKPSEGDGGEEEQEEDIPPPLPDFDVSLPGSERAKAALDDGSWTYGIDRLKLGYFRERHTGRTVRDLRAEMAQLEAEERFAKMLEEQDVLDELQLLEAINLEEASEAETQQPEDTPKEPEQGEEPTHTEEPSVAPSESMPPAPLEDKQPVKLEELDPPEYPEESAAWEAVPVELKNRPAVEKTVEWEPKIMVPDFSKLPKGEVANPMKAVDDLRAMALEMAEEEAELDFKPGYMKKRERAKYSAKEKWAGITFATEDMGAAMEVAKQRTELREKVEGQLVELKEEHGRMAEEISARTLEPPVAPPPPSNPILDQLPPGDPSLIPPSGASPRFSNPLPPPYQTVPFQGFTAPPPYEGDSFMLPPDRPASPTKSPVVGLKWVPTAKRRRFVANDTPLDFVSV
eukprot:TRINITY_DN8317_c0_g1_i1.p1 TRINITY_DN8317_c0_g1~~TRINITY_DN8317_c0_g1_i1.p1  ORF type:complete len:531 (+),score=159.28 TRINITY_DN8317_c0_g1_i1:54-1646(+)